MLTAAAFSALAATCAPQVAPGTLLAIAKVESGLSPLAINDNTARREYSPGTTEEAIALARQLRAAGHNIDLGILQINSGRSGEHWAELHVSLEDTFDPCMNIRAGAEEYCSYDPTQCQPNRQSLSRYNTGSPVAGERNGYVGKVLRAYVQGKTGEAVSMQTAPPTLVAQAEPHDWDVFHDEPEQGDQQTAQVTIEQVAIHGSDAGGPDEERGRQGQAAGTPVEGALQQIAENPEAPEPVRPVVVEGEPQEAAPQPVTVVAAPESLQ